MKRFELVGDGQMEENDTGGWWVAYEDAQELVKQIDGLTEQLRSLYKTHERVNAERDFLYGWVTRHAADFIAEGGEA